MKGGELMAEQATMAPKDTAEFRKYQEMKAKFAPLEKEEAERVEKFQKQLKGLKSGLLRSLKLLVISSTNNEDMIKEMKAGITFEVAGNVRVKGEKQEISGSHKILVKMI